MGVVNGSLCGLKPRLSVFTSFLHCSCRATKSDSAPTLAPAPTLPACFRSHEQLSSSAPMLRCGFVTTHPTSAPTPTHPGYLLFPRSPVPRAAVPLQVQPGAAPHGASPLAGGGGAAGVAARAVQGVRLRQAEEAGGGAGRGHPGGGLDVGRVGLYGPVGKHPKTARFVWERALPVQRWDEAQAEFEPRCCHPHTVHCTSLVLVTLPTLARCSALQCAVRPRSELVGSMHMCITTLTATEPYPKPTPGNGVHTRAPAAGPGVLLRAARAALRPHRPGAVLRGEGRQGGGGRRSGHGGRSWSRGGGRDRRCRCAQAPRGCTRSKRRGGRTASCTCSCGGGSRGGAGGRRGGPSDGRRCGGGRGVGAGGRANAEAAGGGGGSGPAARAAGGAPALMQGGQGGGGGGGGGAPGGGGLR